MRTLFVADLHLSDHTPDLNQLFADFLRDQAGRAAALYILGDLFEAWTGDDDDSLSARQIAEQIRAFSRHAPVYFMAGNRDFLLGKQYAGRANFQILPEPSMLTLYGQHVLLAHGDAWCTDDRAYLRYRSIIRHPVVCKILLWLPFRKRKQMAQTLRAQSRARQSRQLLADVTEAGVQAACAGHRAVEVIVHGHTHRQAVHLHDFGGRQITRYVLPDWRDGRGGYLAVDEKGWQFFSLAMEKKELL